MPSLRQRLIASAILCGMLATASLLVVDWRRQPEFQLSGTLYFRAVQLYQYHFSPLLVNCIRCRYRPTCSEYSRQAVSKYGFVRGMILSVRRLLSCQNDVPLRTNDPVP